jgi:PEP-CTERM motif
LRAVRVTITRKESERFMMPKILIRTLLFFLTVLFFEPSAFANSMVLFDFDEISSQSKKGINAADIEAYMEGLFGADLSVSQNTTVIRSGENSLNLLQSSAGLNDGYLKVGNGKGAGIMIDFGDNPIDSFSVDFRMFKNAKNFAILADGVVINQKALSKAERKAGLAGQSEFFFDTPVHTLQFIGLSKKSFAIDNLVINIPLGGEESDPPYEGGTGDNPTGGGIGITQVGGTGDNPTGGGIGITQVEVAEPSSLLMLAVGLCGALFSRRLRARQR